MENKLFLELVSPERILVSGEVDNVYAVGTDGAFGLHENHSAFCTELVPCIFSYARGGQVYKVVISKGFLTVADNKVNALVERAINADEIDVEKIKALQEAVSIDLSGGIDDEDIRKEKENDLKFYDLALSL